eukprot:SAG31_NODE_4341_length_3339_cov_1.487346_6_plen_53_part_00
MEIVDMLVVPTDLVAGDYVLGWRYDCEESRCLCSSFQKSLEKILRRNDRGVL